MSQELDIKVRVNMLEWSEVKTVETGSVDSIFVLPGVITSLCLDTVDTISARTDVGHLMLPAQLPGTY